jgi:hypothetical protein
VISAGTVEDECRFQARAVGFDQGAHAAEVAFAFFADVGYEEDGAAGPDLGFLDGAGDGDERGEACAVVGDAGCAQAFAFSADLYVGAGGKDGVEMRGEHHDFFVVGAGEFADDVAGLVDLHVESGFGEERSHDAGAGGFLERWRGNFGYADLLIIDPGEILSKPG